MADENNGMSNGTAANTVNLLYRSALLAICGWVLIATLDNGKSNVSIEKDVRYMKEEMAKFVTKDQLDLVGTKLHNEQLQFQVEFLKTVKDAQPQTRR